MVRRQQSTDGRKEAEPFSPIRAFACAWSRSQTHTRLTHPANGRRVWTRAFLTLRITAPVGAELEKKKVMQVRKIDVGGIGETMNGVRADTVELVASHASAPDADR